MSTSIVLAILVTSLATFSSRLLGAISSEGIKETSKLFRYFNCLAYSTLAALIARTIIFPVGVLSDASYLSRATVVLFCLFIFFISKRNFVYPTVILILQTLLFELFSLLLPSYIKSKLDLKLLNPSSYFYLSNQMHKIQ